MRRIRTARQRHPSAYNNDDTSPASLPSSSSSSPSLPSVSLALTRALLDSLPHALSFLSSPSSLDDETSSLESTFSPSSIRAHLPHSESDMHAMSDGGSSGQPGHFSPLASHPDAVVGAKPFSENKPQPLGGSDLSGDALRRSMLNSKWMDDTRQSSANSMSFLRHFPRRKPDWGRGTNQLQRLGGPYNKTAVTDEEKDPIAAYVAGMFLMWGLPLLFSMIALVAWFGFCVSRGWCNACGRHATKLYSDRQININYVLSFCLITIMGVCCAFGWTGNVQVSQGIDSTFAAADSLANYGYEFMGIFSSAYSIAYNAKLLALRFNDSMSVVPDNTTIQWCKACVNTTYGSTQVQQEFVNNLTTTLYYFNTNVTQVNALDAAAKATSLAVEAKVDLSESISPTPAGGSTGNSRLQNLQQQLTALWSALATLPDATQLNTLLNDLQAVSDKDGTAGSSGPLAALTQDFLILHDSARLIFPSLSTTTLDGLNAIDDGVVALGSSLTDTRNSLDASTQGELATLRAYMLAVLDATDNHFPNANTRTNLMDALNKLTTNVTAINGTLDRLTTNLQAYRTSLTSWPASGDALYTNLATDVTNLNNFATSQGAALANMLIDSIPTLAASISNLRASIPPALDSFDITQNQLTAARANVNIDDVKSMITNFNDTAAKVACFVTVLDMFDNINDTLVIFPSDMQALYWSAYGPAVEQVASLPQLSSNLSLALDDLDRAGISMNVSNQPNYSTLTTTLQSLNTMLGSMHDYVAFWHEVLPLSDLLESVTLSNGVTPTYVTSSADTPWFGDVVSVVAKSTTDRPNALSSFTDLYNALQMTTALNLLDTLLTQVRNALSKDELSASMLSKTIDVVSNIDAQLNTLPPLLHSNTPPVNSSTPLTLDVQNSLRNSIDAFSWALSNRTTGTLFNNAAKLTTLENDIGPPADADLTTIREALLGTNTSFLSLANLPTTLLLFITNATQANHPAINAIVTSNELPNLQSFLSSMTIESDESRTQNLSTNFRMPYVTGVRYALDQPNLYLQESDKDVLMENLELAETIPQSFPDFDEHIDSTDNALDAMGSALSYMEEKKQLYQKKSTDFKRTIDNYDGVRLFCFNMGVLLPFLLSLFLLIAAIQHYGCPAMVAGLMFFPLFVLFMVMSAVQMPISVALSDHCYNTTGEIKIQTTGRSYPADNVQFFHLTHDILIPNVVDYFTQCIGEPPEFLIQMQDPLELLRENGVESQQVQQDAKAALGMEFAEPFQQNFDALDEIEANLVKLFGDAVGKLNCTYTSPIYDEALKSLCTDFGPAFALTTCVFLLTAICMIPGIFLGVTSYKRFNPANREAAYTAAAQNDDEPPPKIAW